MSSRSVLLITSYNTPLAYHFCRRARDSGVFVDKMTSTDLSRLVSIYFDDGEITCAPQHPVLVLDQNDPMPVSFDHEFLIREGATVVAAWMRLNPGPVLSCVSFGDHNPSLDKSSCSIVDQNLELPARREVFCDSMEGNHPEDLGLWVRSWRSQQLVSTSAGHPPSLPEGPYWARDSIGPGDVIVVLVVGHWYKVVHGDNNSHKVLGLSKLVAARLEIGYGCLTWWRENETQRDFLAKVDRNPPLPLIKEYLDEIAQKLVEVLTL